MNTTKTVDVTLNGAVHQVALGTTLLELAALHPRGDDKSILAAMLNKRLSGLDCSIKREADIQWLTYEHPAGADVYRRSCSFLLAKALHGLQRNARLVIRHSIGNAYYFDLYADVPVTASVLELIAVRMRQLVALDEPIEHLEYDRDTAQGIFEKKAYADKARLIGHFEHKKVSIYQCGKYIDLDYGPLVPSTGRLRSFELKPYDDGFLLLFPSHDDQDSFDEFVEQPKLFEVYRESKLWSSILEINNVGRLNEIVRSGNALEFIRIAETFHEKKIGMIADEIAKRKRQIRIITISGPSSSGKTTFSKRLSTHLRVCGLRPVALSLDNYFIDRDKNPRDEHGHFDFESIKALDLDLFNSHMVDLLKGHEIEVPRFSFEQGCRLPLGVPMRLYSDQILIIEGIHGLNPELTYLIPHEKKYKIYVSLLTPLNLDDYNRISTADSRLLRRIVRDHKFRGYSAKETISRWPSVKRGEVTWIYPFQEEADMIFNSALIYELSVLKGFAKNLLAGLGPEDNELSEAVRLLKFLALFTEIPPNGVPSTSILREFIGGSSFDY
ncbi:MAG: hypothetical protein A2284_06750 [Deltaproteobacteria bacterium RIFOXYA12_FULL_61_11]|nr:MAG: hypothetical protein A2284_06750 [Deltaproteobacteria bacterium RIFOXYA12_FULL_61_11]